MTHTVDSNTGAVARLIDYGHGRLAALPPHTTMELVENPRAIPVPSRRDGRG